MILKMEHKDIPEVVRMHKDALTGDFFVLLGGKFLSVFYSDIINSRYAQAFVFIKDNRVIGFAAACTDQAWFYRYFIVSRLFILVYSMARSFLTVPVRTFSYFFSSLNFFSRSSRRLPNASIISIAVDKAQRGYGSGARLLESAINYLKDNKSRACWVMTEADNAAADAMYKKSGFIALEVKAFGRSERRFYVKNIAPEVEIEQAPKMYILKRKALAFALHVLPLRIRYGIVEKMRFFISVFSRPKKSAELFWPCEGHAKKRARRMVVFSFDVDRVQCWDNLDIVLESLRQRKLRATFNFLTEGDYDIDWDRVKRIKEEGHEIGLHGKKHDIAFGYRKPLVIKRDLDAALLRFPFKPDGFRSPGLSASDALLEELSVAGFRYDSSIMSFKRPFLYRGGPLWELPICAQDAKLFFDQRLSCEDAACFIKDLGSKLDIVVLNFHPCYAKRFSGFYENLYDAVSKNDGFYAATMNEAVDFLEKENKNV